MQFICFHCSSVVLCRSFRSLVLSFARSHLRCSVSSAWFMHILAVEMLANLHLNGGNVHIFHCNEVYDVSIYGSIDLLPDDLQVVMSQRIQSDAVQSFGNNQIRNFHLL